MEDLIQRFGLIAVFVGASIEGDLVLVLTGVTAHLGLLNLWAAIGVGAAGCLTGDLAWYAVGRARRDAIRRSRIYGKVGPAVERVVKRVGTWQILSARFMYGTRAATMLFWGVHRLSLAQFVSTDAAGCLAWAVLLGIVGYGASSGAAVLIGEVKRAEIWLLGAACAWIVVFLAARWVVNRLKT